MERGDTGDERRYRSHAAAADGAEAVRGQDRRQGRHEDEACGRAFPEGEGAEDRLLALAKRHGISDQTIYVWRKRFGKLEPADVRRLRQLEQENLKLKKLVAERDLEIEVMREVARKKW